MTYVVYSDGNVRAYRTSKGTGSQQAQTYRTLVEVQIQMFKALTMDPFSPGMEPWKCMPRWEVEVKGLSASRSCFAFAILYVSFILGLPVENGAAVRVSYSGVCGGRNS